MQRSPRTIVRRVYCFVFNPVKRRREKSRRTLEVRVEIGLVAYGLEVREIH